MSPDKVTLNSEEIKALAIAIIELHLHLSEGISQLVENLTKQDFFKNSCQFF